MKKTFCDACGEVTNTMSEGTITISRYVINTVDETAMVTHDPYGTRNQGEVTFDLCGHCKNEVQTAAYMAIKQKKAQKE